MHVDKIMLHVCREHVISHSAGRQSAVGIFYAPMMKPYKKQREGYDKRQCDNSENPVLNFHPVSDSVHGGYFDGSIIPEQLPEAGYEYVDAPAHDNAFIFPD